MQKQRTVAFHTLGCKLNFSETSTISRLLETEGFEKKSFEEQADVYVINTCSVTDNRSEEHTSELQSPTTLFPYTTLFRSHFSPVRN